MNKKNIKTFCKRKVAINKNKKKNFLHSAIIVSIIIFIFSTFYSRYEIDAMKNCAKIKFSLLPSLLCLFSCFSILQTSPIDMESHK